MVTRLEHWSTQRQAPGGTSATDPTSRFLSEAECLDLANRAASLAVGGGETSVTIESTWIGNLRYARNEITTSGDVRDHFVGLGRDIQGAFASVTVNQIDDIGLEAGVRRAERMARLLQRETDDRRFREHFAAVDTTITNAKAPLRDDYTPDPRLLDAPSSLMQTQEPHSQPVIFFESTYNLSAQDRVEQLAPLITSARTAKLYAAGYAQVSASGRGLVSTYGQAMYYPYTQAQFSVTVRDPSGSGSGWAGVDWSDWTRINLTRLSDIAMDKCLRSRNPVAVEPGRYTTILEPQAVSDILSPMMYFLDRIPAENGDGPFTAGKPNSKIGLRVLDDRITISADPMDPDLGFVPFDYKGQSYKPVKWIENGVLKELSYDRTYAIAKLGKNSSLPNNNAYRMSGGSATIDDMISTTRRGLLVTRFSGVGVQDKQSILCTGYTRDGLWLIENGKISKAVKNFRFLESPLFIFNNVETLGVPERVFRPGVPTVVPPAKVRDFNFASLIEAV